MVKVGEAGISDCIQIGDQAVYIADMVSHSSANCDHGDAIQEVNSQVAFSEC